MKRGQTLPLTGEKAGQSREGPFLTGDESKGARSGKGKERGKEAVGGWGETDTEK